MKVKRSAMWAATLLLVSVPVFGGELGEILSATLEHPGIAARQLDVQAAQETLSAETARYYGGGRAIADVNRYEGERIVGVFVPDLSGALPPLDRRIDRYGITYRLPVDVFGVIGSARKRAKNDLRAARLVEHQQKLFKLHQVTTAYVRLQALSRQREGLMKRQETLARTMERVKTELALGKAAEVDLRLAESELARLEADRVRLAGTIRQVQAELEEASGYTQFPRVPAIHVPEWRGSSVDETIPVQLSAAHADAARAQAEVARKSLWPGVTFGADYFEFAGDDVTPDAWTVSLGVSVPLDLTAHRRRSAAEFRARAAAELHAASMRETERQLAALESAYDSALADAAALRTELDYRQVVVELEAEKHRLGSQTLENLLRHERDWLDTIFRLSNAEAEATSAWSAARVLAGASIDDYIRDADTAPR